MLTSGCSFPRYLLGALAAGLALAGLALADNSPPPAKLNKRIDNVAFRDAAGQPFALHDLKGKRAVVVVFLSFECPVSNSYAQPLAEMARAYADRGVAFLGVSANDDEDAGRVAEHVRAFKIPFPVYKDDRHTAADAFKAEVTPEAFVLDHHFVLRYRGRIDNGYAARLKKNAQTTRHDLRQALDELLAGKPVTEPVTKAVGCTIRSDRAVQASGAVTYHRDVLPILQNNCQGCHRPGEVGPFALLTYRQAVNWASDIKEYTQARKMPPWKPVEGPAFHNERKLTDKEIATIAAWVDGGTPEGDPKDAPLPRQFTIGWQLGKPDLILTPGEEFQIGASGPDLFRCFVLPTDLPEDKHVVAVEVRPGNPRVVHHALLFIDSTGQGRKLEQQEKAGKKKDDAIDVGPGYSVAMGVGFLPQGGLGGWAPGQIGRRLPEDTAFFLPKGADVVMQVHYHRNGRIEKDRTQIGLYFADKPVSKRWQGLVIPGRFAFIPAGAERYRVTGSLPRAGFRLASDITLYSVMPHMHMLGREITVTVQPPDGPKQTLVAIRDWDYNWQETYLFKEPIKLKAGTHFEVEAYYDNSAKNPNNPFNPPRIVFFGEQTTNEMCFVFLGATADQGGRIQMVPILKEEKPAAEGKAER